MKLSFWPLFAFMLGLGIVPSLVHANTDKACFHDFEREAEQGLRLQTELMMVGLHCAKPTAYQKFTNQNADLLASYTLTLENFFAGQGMKDPEAYINRLQTSWANDKARRIAELSTPVFCQLQRSSFQEILALNTDQLRLRLKMAPIKQKLSYPLCPS